MDNNKIRVKINKDVIAYEGDAYHSPIVLKVGNISYTGTPDYVPEILKQAVSLKKLEVESGNITLKENLVLMLPVLLLILVVGGLTYKYIDSTHTSPTKVEVDR